MLLLKPELYAESVEGHLASIRKLAIESFAAKRCARFESWACCWRMWARQVSRHEGLNPSASIRFGGRRCANIVDLGRENERQTRVQRDVLQLPGEESHRAKGSRVAVLPELLQPFRGLREYQGVAESHANESRGAAMSVTDSIKAMPTPLYSIVDRKTGVYWGKGIFWDKQSAESQRMLLASKYGNRDLRVVGR